ncbi:MAG: DUF1854 domain-containing protein [Fimbriimonadaceae bacterium]|nr:DUF1854 domain-containing protein [Fimbriimonadaceae bacterium]
MSLGLKLFYAPEGRLRAELDGECWLQVRPVWASPMTHPNRYLALLDGRDREICMVTDLSELDPETRDVVVKELDRRYLTSVVTGIISCTTEFGATYWKVNTDRGDREFVTQSLQENALWMSETQLLIVDVDGNRFEIPDTECLDVRSRKLLFATV